MLQNYFKSALRNLRYQSRYTMLNAFGLAIGMTGGLLIFLFVRYHLSTDRHQSKFDRIYRIVYDMHLPDGSVEYNPEAPWPLANVLRTGMSYVQKAAFLSMNRELTVSVSLPGQATKRFLEHSGTAFAEPDWVTIFDYRWVAGNPKTALTQPNTIVLTQSWATRYFGNLNPVGQRVRLNDQVDATVTGLLADPAGVTDLNIGLFISAATLPTLKPGYKPDDWTMSNSTDRLFVVLNNPRSIPILESALADLTRKQSGNVVPVIQYQVQPLADVHFDVKRRGGVIRSSMLWTLGLVGVLLVLTACINFVNLATAQALRRGREVGVRKTLGSSRGQLVGQFLLETSLITLGALIVALLLTSLLLPLFSNWTQTPLTFPLDAPTSLFLSGLMGSVILLAGGYPSVVLSGLTPSLALRGKLTSQAVGGFSLRQLLVITQFVISQTLVIGAMVVTAQLRYIQTSDLGFQKDNVVLVKLPGGNASSRQAFKTEVLSYPDIKAVSVNFLPPSTPGMYGGSFKLGNKADWEKFIIRERFADTDYLDTYGLQLVAGRNLTPSDTIKEYVVNEALLRKLHIRDPRKIIGQTMQYYMSSVPLPIVGVVKDFHLQSLHEAVQPCFIAARADLYSQAGIRISGQNPGQSLQRIQQTWQRFYSSQVFEATLLNESLARYYDTETLISRLVNTFAVLAILIGCLGLYGLVTFVVIQRTKEIGVRKVLGASVTSLVALLTKDFLKLVGVALLIASPLAGYVMNRWLQDFAYRITIEWWVFALAGLLVVGIALLTVSFQSIKAALVNPVQSLRSE